MRAARRWNQKLRLIQRLDREDPIAANAQREAWDEYYTPILRKCVFDLREEKAWKLVERLLALGVDKTDEVVAWFERLMPTTRRPKKSGTFPVVFH